MPKPRKKSNGIWTVIVNYERRRAHVTLGRIPKRDADIFGAQIERLIDHRRHGSGALPADLQAWVESISDSHKQQLSSIGLFAFKSNTITFGVLFDAYLKHYLSRDDIQQSTKNKTESTLRNRSSRIRKFRIDEIEPKQHSIRTNALPVWTTESRRILKDFNSWQRNHYSPATWSRDNKLFSSIGKWAVDHGYCDFNPFTELPTASMVNTERNRYITAEMAMDAMDSTLSNDIRLTIAMGRFCGLRTCSELRTIKWQQVDFEGGTIEIIDSKRKSRGRCRYLTSPAMSCAGNTRSPVGLAGFAARKCGNQLRLGISTV